MARKTKDAPGRVTPKGSPGAKVAGGRGPTDARASGTASGRVALPSGRYTPPIPQEQASSSWLVPAIMLTFFGVGVIGIVLDYLGVYGTPSNWYLLAGLGCIVGGFITATRWR